jgi:hypothetical protein
MAERTGELSMKRLNYALMASQQVDDPDARTRMLISAAMEEMQTMFLLAKVLEEAEAAAAAIEDGAQREKTLARVNQMMERIGYDRMTRTFTVLNATAALASSAVLSSAGGPH